MVFQIIVFVWEFMMDIASISGMGSDEKDLEILLLRQQLRIVERETGTRTTNSTLAEGTTGNVGSAVEEAGKGWKSCAGRKREVVQTGNHDRLAQSNGPAKMEVQAGEQTRTTVNR